MLFVPVLLVIVQVSRDAAAAERMTEQGPLAAQRIPLPQGFGFFVVVVWSTRFDSSMSGRLIAD